MFKNFKGLTAMFLAAAVFSLALGVSVAQAGVTPLAISILAPVQFPPSDFTVVGARVSAFWGQHRHFYGVDVGVIGNKTDLTFAGIGVSGVFNWNKSETTILGLQAAGITNVNVGKSGIFGLQIAGVLNNNNAESTLVGLQIAPLNYSAHTKVYGAQVGLFNKALVVTGFQIGLINKTDVLHGLQIGLVNFNEKGLINVAPILNVGF